MTQIVKNIVVFFFLLAKREVRHPRERTNSGVLVSEEKPSGVSSEPDMSQQDVFADHHGTSGTHDTSGVCNSSLTLSPEPANQSLTFVTPSSSSFIFTPPRCSPTKALPTPIGAEQTGDESAFEEKPPFEEKHVTSTPYLGVGTLRDSIVKRFGTGSRLGSLLEMSCGDSFIDDTVVVLTCKSTFCVFFHWVKICNGYSMLSKQDVNVLSFSQDARHR